MDGFTRLNLASLHDDDEAVTDRVDSLLVRAVQDVLEEGVEAGASIALRLTVTRLDDGSVTVVPSLSYSEPKKKLRGTVAIVGSDGVAQVQTARQMPLIDVRLTRKERSDVDG